MVRFLYLIAWVLFIGGLVWLLNKAFVLPQLPILSEVAALLGVAGISGVVFLAMIGDFERIGTFVAKVPYRRVGWRLRLKLWRWSDLLKMPGALRCHRQIRRNQKLLLRMLVGIDSTNAALPGNVVADAINEIESALEVESALKVEMGPSDFRWYRNWLRASVRPSRDSVIARLLAPTRATALADAAERLVLALDSFLLHEPINSEELTRVRVVREMGAADDQVRFSDFVSAFSGAIVLADSTQTRSGCAADLKVWHSRSYAPQTEDPAEGRVANFDDRHQRDPSLRSRNATCEWESTMRKRSKTRADDYDGRVLDLRAVKLVRDSRNGFVNFVLQTTETCYAATEESRYACKGLRVADVDPLTPRWTVDETTMVSKQTQDPSRLALVTAFAGVVLQYSEKGSLKRALILSRRSHDARNGASALSITGGGVVNLSIGGFAGDEDEEGFPDPIAAVIRELEEELGIVVPRSSVNPEAVYIHNQRDAWTSKDRTATGQLVATTHFTVNLPMTFLGLLERRSHASRHNGLYENSGLVSIEMPPAGRNGEVTDKQNRAAAGRFARSLKGLSGTVDQRAIVSALYASAAIYTIRATVSAFSSVWRQPWYKDNWSGKLETYHSKHDRLARPLANQLDVATFARVSTLSKELWGPNG